jgi:dienelactone hydrolase
MKIMVWTKVQPSRRLGRCARTVWLSGLLAAMPVMVLALDGVATGADPQGPAQIAYAPANAPGPVVIVISGQTGPTSYKKYASELAALGYYTVLLTGKDILNTEHTGEANVRKAIERAQRSPNAIKGKAAVIGFSLGGGGALYNATPQSDLVSMVVAYYPYTLTWANNMDAFVKRFRVPVLVMPGALDRYHNCCVIESMRSMEAAAKKIGAPFELVVYPDANHGFNLETGASGEPGGAYRRDDDLDAWHRTLDMLMRYQALP